MQGAIKLFLNLSVTRLGIPFDGREKLSIKHLFRYCIKQEMAQQNQVWRWITLPSYDLELDDLVKYLRRLFGNYEFYVRVKSQVVMRISASD